MMERTAGRFPQAFVFENVRGITSCKMDDGISVPEEIKKRLHALGFSTNYKLFKASDYGVPQQRYRVVFVGTRRPSPEFDFRLMDEVVKIHSLPSERDGSLSLCLGNVLGSILEDAPNRNDVWNLSESANYMVSRIGKCSGNFEFFKKLSKEAKDRFSLPEEYLRGRSWKNVNPDELPLRFRRIYDNPQTYRAPNFYRRFALGEICGTITASAQPENCGIVHPLEDRRFSIREIARLQSFPDNFKFADGCLIPAYKIIGNAVPPVFGWVIGQALQKYLLGSDEKYELPVKAAASMRAGDQLSLLSSL
jgi:DNA (cytosine-5)-methyltransferase 1